MFFLKKFISGFLVPSTVCVLLMVAGLVLLWFTRRERVGKILTTVGVGLLLLFSNPALSELMLAPLENRNLPLYPDQRLQSVVPPAGGNPPWIVVLSAGHIADPRVPPSGQLGTAAVARVLEGIRLHRRLPGSRLLLSGGIGSGTPQDPKHADLLGAVADVCAVDRPSIVLHRSGWDTEEEAETISKVVGTQPFLLVTSASHMPRALGLFRRRGANPIPASAFFYTMDEPGFAASDLVPNPGALNASNAGMHEYIGLVWSKLRGRL
jgi:uncharacterized SAM-binding protein YcdF (DUF218 family)